MNTVALTGSIVGFLVYFSDSIKFSITGVTYYMARNFQSCDSLCASVQQVCASTEHGLDGGKDVLAIFKRLGVNCSTSGQRDNYRFSIDPVYRTAENNAMSQWCVGKCLGFIDVPSSINCRSTTFSDLGGLTHWLCPCRGKNDAFYISFDKALVACC